MKQRAHDCTAGCRREEVFVFVWCCYFEKKDRKIFEQRKQSRRKVRKVQKKENIYEEKKRGLRRLVLQAWELLNRKHSRVDTSASRNASCWQARAGCEYSLFCHCRTLPCTRNVAATSAGCTRRVRRSLAENGLNVSLHYSRHRSMHRSLNHSLQRPLRRCTKSSPQCWPHH